jgi:hypothetical protein
LNRGRKRPPFLRAFGRLRTALWRRRVAHGLIRAAWLTLLVPTFYRAGHYWLGWTVPWRQWAAPTLLVGTLALVWSLRPIPLYKLAQRLDDRLALRNRMVTALEVKQAGEDENPVVARLMGEAVTLAIGLRRRVSALNLGFWLELQTLIALCAIVGGILMLEALQPVIPDASVEALPQAWQEPTADELLPPNPRLFPPPFQTMVQPATMDEGQMGESLEALADALRGQAVTRAIADAIDAGDLGQAAEELRRLGDRLGELSEEARQELAQALEEAAGGVGEDAPTLSEPLGAASDALESGDLSEASQALEQLAEALESLEEAPAQAAQAASEEDVGAAEESSQEDATSSDSEAAGEGGGAGAGEGDASETEQPTQAERLAVEGQPLELESDAESDAGVVQPGGPGDEPGGERAQVSPFARQATNQLGEDLGPDPLTYPWALRDVIRRYFTP